MDDIISWNPGPFDHPLRAWDVADPNHRVMLRLQVQNAGAEAAVKALLAGEPLSDADVSAFGRANSLAYISTYEPIFHLIHDRVHIGPEVREVLSE